VPVITPFKEKDSNNNNRSSINCRFYVAVRSLWFNNYY